MRKTLITALGFVATLCGGGAYAQDSSLSNPLDLAGTDNILFLPQDVRQQAFASVRALSPTRTIGASAQPLAFNPRPTDWSALEYEVDGESFSLEDYLARKASRGLMVTQGSDVLLERYAEGNTAETRWITFSVTKSLTSLLIGAAIQDGYIESVEESVADYLPRLKGTPYADVKIKDVLNMASGVAWDEDYASPSSDVAQAGAYNGPQLIEYLSKLPKVAEPGERFNYNTGETNLAGELLRSAIGNNASTYLETKIWRPFGMEHDAYWLLSEEGGVETGGCCVNATLRDYARIGRFVLAGGMLSDGTRVVPEGWIAESVAPSTGNPGYGYLWWLYDSGAFSARGIFQQRIFIDPARDLVIAVHSNAANAVSDEDAAHTDAVIMALRGMVPKV